ncbi:GNAT family N-acetyltransferase [Anaerocolumna sedimenticola]|uniref:GNAT family N-acetyltransferase n=1 Tax=Anaerocolumna sedimenticola TaxID=2696063 RepID=A0A6P1TU00_9FIRM|nr:GNAT family N-acetyltransferase [Anaerocolumna sedimenticola]QHQ63176.1 GNAT family N-acetyltransferase [Anaerocolumna sedimenticola]
MGVTITTREMKEEEFGEYKKTSIKEYAKEIVTAGRVSEDTAVEEASKTFESLTPENGKNTEKNCLYIVEADGIRVGIFWYLIQNILDEDVAFIADIRLDEAERGKGYGRKILQFFEKEAKDKGYKVLGLNVFKDNPAAIHLYESEDYKIAVDSGGSLYMIKRIGNK